MVSRKILEREANSLGIPWTSLIEDSILQKMVQKRKELLMVNQDIPDCFGVVWEAVGTSECMGCTIKDPCLHKFALGVLKTIRAELGDEVSIETLMEKTGVKIPEAIITAIEYAAVHANSGVKEKEVVKEKIDEEPVAIPPPSESVLIPEIVPPATEVKTKKNGGVTKKTKKAAVLSHPPQAGFVKCASDPVLKQGNQFALPVAAQELLQEPLLNVPELRQQWGKGVWEARHQRERERWELSARLMPGMKLLGLFRKKVWEVQVLKQGYRYSDKEYPTLYAVMVDILGTYQATKVGSRAIRKRRRTPNYSAPRFFRKAIGKVLGVSTL